MIRLTLGPLLLVLLLLFDQAAMADESAAAQIEAASGEKVVSGMSIVGNDEAPKALAIVPWKESLVGDALDLESSLGAGRDPVDPDVFRRELTYYRIRVGEQ